MGRVMERNRHQNGKSEREGDPQAGWSGKDIYGNIESVLRRLGERKEGEGRSADAGGLMFRQIISLFKRQRRTRENSCTVDFLVTLPLFTGAFTGVYRSEKASRLLE